MQPYKRNCKPMHVDKAREREGRGGEGGILCSKLATHEEQKVTEEGKKCQWMDTWKSHPALYGACASIPGSWRHFGVPLP